ncbi:MAG TPA: PilZ domain-containing protein [Stellaceae bacterium]|nr:PilZ domain-containing protein [Stellaceae bacterium]
MTSRNSAALAAAEMPVGPVEAREDRRRQILWSAVLQTARGPCHCLVVDISRGGARIARAPAVGIGQAVTLMVTGLGMFRGTVVWSETGNLGIEFVPQPGAGRA